MPHPLQCTIMEPAFDKDALPGVVQRLLEPPLGDEDTRPDAQLVNVVLYLATNKRLDIDGATRNLIVATCRALV